MQCVDLFSTVDSELKIISACRFPPEKGIGANKGLDIAQDLLEPIKQQFPWISYSDLWTLAGAVAIEEMGGAYQSHSMRPLYLITAQSLLHA